MATTPKVKIIETASVQKLDLPQNFEKIICPSRMLIAGPSMSGKSTFVLELVKHKEKVYSATFERIIYCLPDESLHLHQEFEKELRAAFPAIEIIEGLPNITQLGIKDSKAHKLLILDDLMFPVFESHIMLNLITKDSHHSNCSVVITCQNFYHPSKYGRTFVRNCSEKVLFFDKTDAKQLSMLSMQIYPNKPNFLKSCFDWIFQNRSEAKLKYLLIDSSTLSHFPHNALVRSFIFPGTNGQVTPILFFPHAEKQ